MGYLETEGVILSRRNIFEEDQEIFVLTPRGGFQGRAPHARGSQKTYCGRLEPPNLLNLRLYRAREHSDWIISDLNIREVFSDLLHRESLRYHLWPLLSLYRDLFPEEQPPGDCYPRLVKAFGLLKEDFDRPLVIIDRLLVKLAAFSGIAHSLRRCGGCATTSADEWRLDPERGLFCNDCLSGGTGIEVPGRVLGLYRDFLDNSWPELKNKEMSAEQLENLESIMYRFFHYHFDIRLEALKVRQQL